jgi:hypothetical protein
MAQPPSTGGPSAQQVRQLWRYSPRSALALIKINASVL